MAVNYKYLNRAQLSINYLHSNSTTHEFLFGALAEMIDNSRDANAKNIHIYEEANSELRGGYMICFLDDGCGMSPSEARDIMTFGRSFKKDDTIGDERKMIGQYGNGLKSGSMRIGNDFILFTKCHNQPMTCLLLSRTFHEEEKIDEVIVPSPSFHPDTKELYYEDEDTKEKAEIELGIISRYSPFKSLSSLHKIFDRISSPSGTLVCVYSLKLDANGKPEIDFTMNPLDFTLPISVSLPNSDDSLKERTSFSAYLSLLYNLNASSNHPGSHENTHSVSRSSPNSEIWLRNKRVERVVWTRRLFAVSRYVYSSAKFRARAMTDADRAAATAKIAEEIAREAESKARDLSNRYGHTPLEKHKRMEIRKCHEQAHSLRQKANLLKQNSEKKMKTMKDPKSIDLIFGINLEDRTQTGAFVYNQSRLIKMYQPFNNNSVSSIKNNGVVCLIDIPYEILEPTHNKQDFADEKEWKFLKTVINSHYNDYVFDVLDKNTEFKNWKEFWKYYGYEAEESKPSNETLYLTRRAMVIPKYKQCVRCSKYRKTPFQLSDYTQRDDEKIEELWECSQNQDKKCNRCDAPELKLDIPLARLRKVLPKQNHSSHMNNSRVDTFIVSDREDSEDEQEYVRESRNRITDKISNSYSTSTSQTISTRSHQNSSTKTGFESSTKTPLESGFNDSNSTLAHALNQSIASLRRPPDLSPSVHSVKVEYGPQVINNNASHHSPSSILNNGDVGIQSQNNNLKKSSKPPSYNSSKPKRKRDDDPAFTASKSVISAPSTKRMEDKVDKLAEQLRTVLKFFVPPNYTFNAQDVAQFDCDKLLSLDIPKLKAHYEDELKKLISKESKKVSDNFNPLENDNKELEHTKATLIQLRRNVSTLLRLTSPGINLEANCQSEDVDSFVIYCLSMMEQK
ncbi:unnamed protein product [Gordionus sp. m RMFG-2023]|uniref:ATPase MORC2-like n=1 Tax=Gordionus sp. m RMFG-2023 TaxID=3053472 RepID=UPI0030E1B564